MLIGYRPEDEAYVSHTGAVFHPQDENNNETAAYYEIQGTTDSIVFDVNDHIGGLNDPVMTLYTNWGETDFDLRDEINDNVIIAEQSGFDTDIWLVEVASTSGRFELTQFDTANGVDGTQAAWLPYIGLISSEV
jgi:hypothetical protein